MKQGNLEERVLARSVLKHIHRETKELKQGTAVGQDFAWIGDRMSADGLHEDPAIAWIKAQNNFACSGGTAVSARLLCMLPVSYTEPEIKKFMTIFRTLAKQDHVQIEGGQTVVDPAVAAPRFYVTISGVSGIYRQREIHPGCQIIMTKDTGLLGTDLLIAYDRDKLEAHFSKMYIASATRMQDEYRVIKEAAVVNQMVKSAETSGLKPDIYYMHDVSAGGVYSALWQMAVRLKKGIRIEHAQIPIRQETIEICEYYNINPYLLEGTGSMLIVCEDADRLCSELTDSGIAASVIGQIAENQDKVIVVGEDERYLTSVSGDAIYDICTHR